LGVSKKIAFILTAVKDSFTDFSEARFSSLEHSYLNEKVSNSNFDLDISYPEFFQPGECRAVP
jgi:hypothetical protein